MISKKLIWENEPKGYVIEFSQFTNNAQAEKELVGYRVIEKVGRVYIVEEIDKL